MRKFFNNISEIDQYTMQLGQVCDTLKCQNCSKGDQFISHGFVYKKQHHGDKIKVGKRIFCTNRYGRSGCGSTFQLYLCPEIPVLHYGCFHLLAFLNALLGNASIQASYEKATGTDEPRNAYRWLNKLEDRLIDYRHFLKVPNEMVSQCFKSRPYRFQILLSTIQRLLSCIANPWHYQLGQQDNFL